LQCPLLAQSGLCWHQFVLIYGEQVKIDIYPATALPGMTNYRGKNEKRM